MRHWTGIIIALLAAALLVPMAPAASSTGGGPAAGAPDRSWPLAGLPVLRNGFRPPAYDWLPGHRGVDLAAVAGEPVLAPLSGTVSFSGRVVDRSVLVITSGGLRVSLEPVIAEVGSGSPVVAGQPIGRVGPGSSHCSPVPCLHWGLRVAGEYRNPLLLVLRGRPVLVATQTASPATGPR